MKKSNGGHGFFKIDDFLMAQKLSWITRAIKYRIDNWRIDLYILAPDYDITRLRKIDIDRERHPILFNLVESLEYFHGQFIKENGNRFLCNIFCTPGITYDNGNSVISIGTFGRDFYTRHKEIIRRLTYSDFFRNERHRTLDDIRETLLPLTVNAWLKIRSAIARTEQLLKKDATTDRLKISIKDLLTGINKGSKKVRQVLARTRTRQELANMRTVTTFCNLVGLPVPENKVIEMYIKIWGFPFLQNEICEFIFKQRNNCLMLNNRLNAIDPEVDATCTLCRIRGFTIRDGFEHGFFGCLSINGILTKTCSLLVPVQNVESVEFRRMYWFGIVDDEVDMHVTFFFDILRYVM